MKYWMALLLAVAFAAGCASVDSAAASGSSMATKNLGHTSTATKSAEVDGEKEAGDMEKAAGEGADMAKDEMSKDDAKKEDAE